MLVFLLLLALALPLLSWSIAGRRFWADLRGPGTRDLRAEVVARHGLSGGEADAVQAAVTRDPTGGVDLTNLVEDELLAHATREGPRLRIEGGDIALQPKAAESISLAIHELTTNAVKYGALSGRTGGVEVRWGLEDGAGAERLRFEWIERGVAPPAEARRDGFGTELLLRTLPYELDAETRMDFGAEGLRFEMLVPAERALAVRSGASRARS